MPQTWAPIALTGVRSAVELFGAAIVSIGDCANTLAAMMKSDPIKSRRS
jgi:hypothetical protein